MSEPRRMAPDVLADVQPPAVDRLGVLSATAQVVHDAQQVRIVPEAVGGVAARWAQAPWPETHGLDALHFSDGSERTVNWLLLLDALNFCFWGEPGQPRWRIAWRGQTLDGYAALAAGLSRGIEAGRPLWDATYLATLSENDLADILRPVAGSPEIPLLAERLAHAREVGRVLLDRYDGQFAHACDAAQGSAVTLALLLAREFASFADIATWRGVAVPLLKRAQICVADLHAAFDGARWGHFTDLDGLTAFADYKLPQRLRSQGVLVYADALAAQVDAQVLLSAGSEAEVEIRAATIWGVELLRRALAERGVIQLASAIDYRLWAESQQRSADERPYHRTRTIYY